MGLLLFIIAYILYLPLTIINFFVVKNKSGYFKNSAVNLDKFGNREFRTLLNKTLILKDSEFKFGDIRETISGVLGKNECYKKLTTTGKVLVWILNKLDKNHCWKSADWTIRY
jgi:hypothetical protein